MSNDREEILATLKSAKDQSFEFAKDKPFSKHAYDKLDINYLIDQLKYSKCEVHEINQLEQLPAGIAKCIKEHELDNSLVVVDDLIKLNWNQAKIKTSSKWSEDYTVSVTKAHGAIAETGQLVITGSCDKDRLSLLAYTHIVVLERSNIYPSLDFLPKLLTNKPEAVVTLIAGPSRTADIEQTLVLGAHGPKRVIVFLVGSSNKEKAN